MIANDRIKVTSKTLDAMVSLYQHSEIVDYVHITPNTYVEREDETGPLLYVEDNKEHVVESMGITIVVPIMIPIPTIKLECGKQIKMTVVD